MAQFSKCPHCGNRKKGLDIYKCSNCKRVVCYYDGIFGFGSTGCWHDHSKCPNCKERHTIGKIGEVW
jgi:hypothetical protein